MLKLDYSIESPQERKKLVEKILEEQPDFDLETLADYLIFCMEKQERKEKKILTDNRLATVGKRERSYEGLAAQLESGEDGLQTMISEDKNVIFQPRISITQEDLDTIPALAQLRESITDWEARLKRAEGRQAFTIKKALIEMRKDQYIIKQAYQRPISFNKLTKSSKNLPPLNDSSHMEGSKVVVEGVSLMDPKVISGILCNYSKLKEDSYDCFDGDTWYLIQAFDEIAAKALSQHGIYERIVELKIDKKQNTEIQATLEAEFGKTYSPEYISSLWRNKIPKLIATAAKEDYLIWQYRINDYPMKRCSKCGELKPANNQFFSRNLTSKDYFYSICKKCRNKKKEG